MFNLAQAIELLELTNEQQMWDDPAFYNDIKISLSKINKQATQLTQTEFNLLQSLAVMVDFAIDNALANNTSDEMRVELNEKKRLIQELQTYLSTQSTKH